MGVKEEGYEVNMAAAVEVRPEETGTSPDGAS